MQQVGIVLNHLGASQQAFYAIKEINKQLDSHPHEMDYILFYENMVKPCLQPNCAVMNYSELVGFNGTVIVTSMSQSIFTSNIVSKMKKIFYIWDLDWMRKGQSNFLYNVQAFKDCPIIARSKDHVYHIENYANCKVAGVVEDFRMDELKEYFNV